MNDSLRLPRKLLFASLLAAPLAAQTCPPVWTETFPYGDAGGMVRVMTLFDEDDTGPDLPKLFAVAGSIGGVDVYPVGRFDGQSWTRLFTGTLMNGFNFAE